MRGNLYFYMIFGFRNIMAEKLPVILKEFKGSLRKLSSASFYETDSLITVFLFFFCMNLCFAPLKPSKCVVCWFHHGYFQTSFLRCFSCRWGISEWHFPSGLQVPLTDLPDCPTSTRARPGSVIVGQQAFLASEISSVSLSMLFS